MDAVAGVQETLGVDPEGSPQLSRRGEAAGRRIDGHLQLPEVRVALERPVAPETVGAASHHEPVIAARRYETAAGVQRNPALPRVLWPAPGARRCRRAFSRLPGQFLSTGPGKVELVNRCG